MCSAGIITTYSCVAVFAIQAGAFWMFAGIAVLAFIFVLFVVPETKGKTLEEIEALLGSKSRSNADPSLQDPLVDHMDHGVGA